MKYWTHWHNIKYELGKKKERMLIRIAWWMPRSIAYWCTIRVGSHATTGKYSNQVVPDLLYTEALKRWNK